MAKTGKAFFVSALLMFSTFAHGQTVDVTAIVDRNQMGVGDTLTYSVSVASDSDINVPTPRWPNLQSFQLVNSWSGSEVRSTFSNGSFG